MISLSRLAELFATHASPLTLYARQLSDEPDDVVQEAFVRLMCIEREPPNVRAWLATTVRRIAIDRRRAVFRRRRRESNTWRTPCFEPSDATTIDAQRATELLMLLPTRQREVVVLKLWNDLTFAEIAAIVGLSDSTVHDDFKNAMRALKRQLEM